MRTLIGLIATVLVTIPAFGADVGVSLSIGEPGFYGRIDIGNAPPPVLVYREPILVMHSPQPATIYLRVPPGHARDWPKHCGSYGACGQRVYFVQDGWYNDVYAPHYRKNHGNKGGGKKGGKGNSGKGHKG